MSNLRVQGLLALQKIPRRDGDDTTRGGPHQRSNPSQPRPTSTESPDAVTPTVNQARSLPTAQMLSEVQNACWLWRRTRVYEPVSTINENENPKEGRPTGLRLGRKVA